MMKRIITLLFAVCLAWTANAQFPGWGGPRNVVTDTIYSNILKAERQYTIYLPRTYEQNPDKKYPVLYLLHGMSGVNTSWFRDQRATDVMNQLLDEGGAKEMIIVSPNAGGNIATDWNGYFNMPGWAYEDFFYQEFLPYIEKTYRIIGDKEHRAIAGLSMGGGGATSYAQRHPDMYCAVYALSALMDIPGGSENPTPGQEQSKMQLLTNSVMELSCVKFVENADEATKAQLKSIKWYVDCGDDDFLLDRNIEFVQAMKKAGIPLQFRVRDGGHTNDYWHTGLFTLLPFISMAFGE